jgi:hypothetical protein
MVEHLKNFGVGVGILTVIIILSVAINWFLTYIGTEYAFYLLLAFFISVITYVFGSLVRTILFDKNVER